MKKLLLIVTSIAVGSFSFAQNKMTQRMVQTIQNVNNIIALQNKGDIKGLKELMAAGALPTGKLQLEYNATAMQFDTIDMEIYQDYVDGFAKVILVQNYDSGSFVNAERSEYFATIDTANGIFDLDSLTYDQWNAGTNSWDRAYNIIAETHGFFKFDKVTTYLNSALFSMPFGFLKWAEVVYYYDGNDFLTAEAGTALNLQTLMMVPGDSIAYTNDVNGNPTTEITYEYFDYLMAHRADEKIVSTYDANDNALVEIYYWYDTLNTVFVESYEFMNTYDANNNRTVRTQLSWNSGTSAFVNGYNDTYTYNANNDETLNESSNWDDINSVWIKTWRKTTAYKAGGEPDYDLIERSSDDGATWINEDEDEKNIYLYDVSLSTSSIANNNSVKLYPNPSNGLVTLAIENGSTATVTLFNIAGQAVYSQVVNATSNVTLDFSSLVAGSYLMQVKDVNNVDAKRLVITE